MKTLINVATKLPANVAAKVPSQFLSALTGFGMTVALTVIALVLIIDFQVTGCHRTAAVVAVAIWAVQLLIPMFLRELRNIKKGGKA